MLNDILIKISQKETILDELNTEMFMKGKIWRIFQILYL